MSDHPVPAPVASPSEGTTHDLRWEPCSSGGLWQCKQCDASYCSPPWTKAAVLREPCPASASRGETPPRDAPTSPLVASLLDEPLDAAERGILRRWAEKMVDGVADFPTADKKQHARTILRYEAALSASQRAREESRDDAERYRFLRDNPLQLRAIDGNAGFHGQWSAEHFDRFTDAAREDAARAAQPEGPANAK